MKIFSIFIVIFLLNYDEGFGQFTEETRKINLEDIEDDNLLSEKLAKQSETLITQQTQSPRPPSILGLNSYLTQQQNAHQQTDHIIYATPSTAIKDAPHHGNQIQQVQYVTQKQQPEEMLKVQHFNQQQQQHPPTYTVPAAVHEHEPGYTYTTSSSRQSLSKPNQLTRKQQRQDQKNEQHKQYGNLSQGHANKQHPHYYQHHRPQIVQQVVGGIQYVTQPQSPTIIYNHSDDSAEVVGENEQQKLIDEQQIVYHHHHAIPPQVPSGATYLQYVPYIANGLNDGQSYVVMAPIPAGYGQSSSSNKLSEIISYTHDQEDAHQAPLVQYIPTSLVGGVQYVTSNDIENIPQTVQPHPNGLHTPYSAYTTAYFKQPANFYTTRFPYTNLKAKGEMKEMDETDSQSVEDESIKVVSNSQSEENTKNPEFIKQLVEYTPQVQDYSKVNRLSYDTTSYEKSKQHQYAPLHPEKLQEQQQQQPQQSKSPSAKSNQNLSVNHFSSFQSTTESPQQKYIFSLRQPKADSAESNEQNQKYSTKLPPSKYWRPMFFSMPTKQQHKLQYQSSDEHATTSRPITSQIRTSIAKHYETTSRTFPEIGSTAATVSITPLNYHLTPTKQSTIQRQQILSAHLTAPTVTTNNNNNFDIFRNRQAKSLLDSYIPSWVIIENQNKNMEQQSRSLSNSQPNNYHIKSYDTISYSVPQVNNNNINKRSSIRK